MTFSRVEYEARLRLADHLWPVLVDYLQDDQEIPAEDRERMMLAIGVALYASGKIHVDDVGSSEMLRAKAERYLTESSWPDLARLTRQVRTEAELTMARREMDVATGEALRALTLNR